MVADSDECAAEESCAQRCRNTEGSFECACADGYRLLADRSSCEAINGKRRSGAGSLPRRAPLEGLDLATEV